MRFYLVDVSSSGTHWQSRCSVKGMIRTITPEVEGHTDSVGGDEYNMRLSENRANAVRSYLLEQGVGGGAVSAKGFGKTVPVADNSTAAGRQMNRRVELVVSGEILGTSISDASTSR